MKQYYTKDKPIASTITAEEIARVKGLGFLRDKTTPDCFNGRVITRNGKITAEESIHIAEAAKRFGSGEIAMSTRMTVEIWKWAVPGRESVPSSPARELPACSG